MINVLTKNGVHVDASSAAKFALPAVEINDVVLERKETVINKWDAILSKTEKTEYGAKINKFSEGGKETLIREGFGIFKRSKTGQVVKVHKNSMSEKDPLNLDIPNKIGDKPYKLFLFTLYPNLLSKYLNDVGLDVNHCIIPEKGYVDDPTNSEFFEIVGRGRNIAHSKFVGRYNLYKAPVSSFDLDRLEDLYEAYRVLDVQTDDEEGIIPEKISDVFENKSVSKSIKRRLITWVYFINYHTDGEDRIWEAFRVYWEEESGSIWTGNLTDLKNEISKFVVFV